ncbi:MAG: hypothetical protein R3A46_12540 [Thermomicrobiales bacterium]
MPAPALPARSEYYFDPDRIHGLHELDRGILEPVVETIGVDAISERPGTATGRRYLEAQPAVFPRAADPEQAVAVETTVGRRRDRLGEDLGQDTHISPSRPPSMPEAHGSGVAGARKQSSGTMTSTKSSTP